MGTELPRGATVWLLINSDAAQLATDIRVYASETAARQTVSGFLAREVAEGRVWTDLGDLSDCGVEFRWLHEGSQMTLREMLVRR